MPIILSCPSCALRLQVPDELAGRQVSCSGCRAVITAPAAPPPVPAPARPVPPPPVPAPHPAASPNPFAFGGPLDDPDRDERERPRERARDRDRDRDDRDDDYAPPRASNFAGGRGRWAGFYTGCGLAKWGAVVEMVGVAYLFVIIELAILEAAGAVRVARIFGDLGAFLPIPFFIPVLVGTAMMAIGRLRMAGVPAQTGAGGVLSFAGILTIIRFVLLLAAMILLLVAMTSTSRRGFAGESAAYAFGAMFGGWLIGTLAEVTSVAAIGAAGAGLDNRTVTSTAAGAGLVHQVLGLILIVLFLIGYFAGAANAIGGRREVDRPGLMGVIWLLVFVIQIVFTYAQYALYAAGEKAGR